MLPITKIIEIEYYSTEFFNINKIRTTQQGNAAIMWTQSHSISQLLGFTFNVFNPLPIVPCKRPRFKKPPIIFHILGWRLQVCMFSEYQNAH
jgi:hypothetical protein